MIKYHVINSISKKCVILQFEIGQILSNGINTDVFLSQKIISWIA